MEGGCHTCPQKRKAEDLPGAGLIKKAKCSAREDRIAKGCDYVEGQLAKYIKASQVGSGILDPVKRLIKKFRVPAGKLATGLKNAVKDFGQEYLSERKLKKYG